MKSYSKRRGKERRSRRQKRQRGGQGLAGPAGPQQGPQPGPQQGLTGPPGPQPGSQQGPQQGPQPGSQQGPQQGPDPTKFIQDAVDKMKTMNVQTLKRVMASGFRKLVITMSGIMQAQMISLGPMALPNLDTIGPAISTFLQSNTPAEFSAFSGQVRIETAVLFVIVDTVVPDYDPTKNPPMGSVTNSRLASNIQTYFSLFKTISPADALQRGDAAGAAIQAIESRVSANPALRSQVDSIGQSLFPQLIPGIVSQVLNMTPDDLITYPVWNNLANEEFNINVDFNNLGTKMLPHLLTIGMVTIMKPFVDDIINPGASASSSSTTTRPPLRIPAGMIAWLNANKNSVTRSLKANVTAAVTNITLAYPTETTTQMIQQEAGKLSVQTSTTPIPAAMVSWLAAQLPSTPNSLKGKVTNASTYIKRAFPSQTSTSAGANELIML